MCTSPAMYRADCQHADRSPPADSVYLHRSPYPVAANFPVVGAQAPSKCTPSLSMRSSRRIFRRLEASPQRPSIRAMRRPCMQVLEGLVSAAIDLETPIVVYGGSAFSSALGTFQFICEATRQGGTESLPEFRIQFICEGAKLVSAGTTSHIHAYIHTYTHTCTTIYITRIHK